MRDSNVFAIRKALPRMSWSVRNLYNLWVRTQGPKHWTTSFKRSDDSLFQQRWRSKALVRAYHGDFINEKTFKRWYLPQTLPDVRPRARTPSLNSFGIAGGVKSGVSGVGDDTAELKAFAGKAKQAVRDVRKLKEEEEKGLAPVGSLMFAEVERRVDVVIFRSCFAHSVYEARRLVIHGDVMLNGKKHTDPNTRLAPGDMISVNPSAIRFLQPPPKSPSPPPTSEPASEASSEASPTSEASPSESTPSEKPTRSRRQKDPKETLTPFNLPPYASPHIFIPPYIEPSFPTCSAIYVRHPTARPGYSEIPTPFEADGEVVRLAWEWYSRVRPRVRGGRRFTGPENRQ
ncbi:hypothetical protein JAAARDRAFT_163318 [Jaapia argillacea MUCL 33604]|uniref:RNA-binding S4 domain-containing protein n=1 Tax=Jaapia argillacea MUCL 33604 TaxID=933084 RepID=A0A067PNK8_9AGAM|nr:hypothetical protein JAAARDRAFT_163318 [Jaapia argillacea MUCL 33604]